MKWKAAASRAVNSFKRHFDKLVRKSSDVRVKGVHTVVGQCLAGDDPTVCPTETTTTKHYYYNYYDIH